MTTKPLDSEDPMALVGVQLEEGPDDRALMEMAWCFAKEYAPPPAFRHGCGRLAECGHRRGHDREPSHRHGVLPGMLQRSCLTNAPPAL